MPKTIANRMVALGIALALVMLVNHSFSNQMPLALHLKLLPFEPSHKHCVLKTLLSAEMKAELEKAKKEAEAAKKVFFIF